MREQRPDQDRFVDPHGAGDAETFPDQERLGETGRAPEREVVAERQTFGRPRGTPAARRYEQAPQHRRSVDVQEGGMEGPREAVHSSIYLQPIASPSVLGLFALAAAAFIYGAWLAGWYGTEDSPGLFFPFIALFGGLAQLLAGMWAFRARDTIATLVFASVGAMWLAYGVLHLTSLLSDGLVIPAGGFSELGYWFIPIALITWVAAAAAFNRSIILAASFGVFALGLTFLAMGQIASNDALLALSGWVLVLSALIAAYTASALLLNDAMEREVLPLATRAPLAGVAPGRGEPGVVRGDWPSDELALRRDQDDESGWEFQWPIRRRAA